MTKVSVVMPVYNTGLYVAEALNSILNQTLRDIEIIVVDDGSTDNSCEIVSQLASTDSRIKFYKQASNEGQAVARNIGLRYITGKYVYFMDSDDVLAADALECCYRKCEEEDLNAVIFEAEVLTEDKETRFSFNYHYKDLEDRVYGGIELMNFLLDTNQFCVSPCMLLLRASLLKRWSPVFYSGIIHEDQLFTVMVYLHATQMGYIKNSFFRRRIRPASTMTKKISRKNRIGYQTVFEQLSLFALTQKNDIKALIDKHRAITLNAFLSIAWPLSFQEKMIFLLFCFRKRYVKQIRFRNFALFLFKQLKKG
ncbi:glycosyltransferase family 2 protein [Odoribacter laneus]|uniref:glycosyltransferase family 2 protein n=1 Tax=Odoribacter laneus TaxID=626933 RepID=UPI003AB31E94